MTILNASIMPSLRIKPDEDYETQNHTFVADAAGVQVISTPLTVKANASLVVESGASVTGLVTPTDLVAAMSSKMNTADATSALSTKADAAAVKRTDTYTGVTDASGLFIVTYAVPFLVVPTVQPEPPSNPTQTWVKVSSTTTGFSLRLVQRNTVTLLAVEVLLGTTVNVVGAAVRAAVIAA